MEWKMKRYHACVDPALDILESMVHKLSKYPPHLDSSIQRMYWELKFFKMFFWGLGFPEELLEGEWMLRLTIMVKKMRKAASEFKQQFEAADDGEKFTHWDPMIYRLRTITWELKSQARDSCYLLLDGGFICKYSCQLQMSSYKYRVEIEDFMCLLQRNLGVLRFPQQEFDFIQAKLELFGAFAKVLNKWPYRCTSELTYRIQTWASHISCLTYLYFLGGYNSSLASTMETLCSDLMRKTLSFEPQSIMLILDVFKVGKHHKFQGTILSQFLADYVAFLIEHAVMKYAKDDVETLREGLAFLFSFAMDRPNEDSVVTKSILAEIYAVMSDIPSVVCTPGTNYLCDFLHKVDVVKAKVKEVYVVSSFSSRFNSPRTNAIGSLDSLLEKLNSMLEGGVNFIPSVKNQLIGVRNDLALLRPSLQDVLELQNEDSRLNHLHTQIVSVINFSTYVTLSCPITSFSVWYGIVCLPKVKQDIKLIKCIIQNIGDDLNTCSSKKLTTEVGSSNALLKRQTTSKHEGAFIGFREDVESILDMLRGGQRGLTVISISGMPGQGKTRLAKRIFDDPKVRYHFQKTAWGYVGKECNFKHMLTSILRFHSDNNDQDNWEIQDLTDKLRKSLKGIRYFIVLDDIWDVATWLKVQESFPDDRNGSRILFTSRNCNLALQSQLNSISYPLRLFSDEESLELIKDNFSSYDDLPPELLKVGKQIAQRCKGLPLAVALIGSHLKRMTPELVSWMEVAENLKSRLATEGCMHIIELSYKYLRNHLKPCLLQFGMFAKGAIISISSFMQIWIAQGLVMKNEQGCSEDLAREYLDYLVSQNLVIVSQRGSMGKIKRCMIHDLIHDMCLQKATEDNLLRVIDCGSILRDYNHHHRWLCVRDIGPDFIQLSTSSTRKNPLTTSQVHSLYWDICESSPGNKSLSTFLGSFRVLTMLDMLCTPLQHSTIPETIFTNIHLRYLSLRGPFQCISRSIVKLWSLETLVIQAGKYIVWLPKFLWEMNCLRSLCVVKSCLNFDGFRQNLSSVASASIIHTLAKIPVPCDAEMQEFLSSLSRLRKLSCYYHDIELHTEWFFGSLKKLESLKIERSTVISPRVIQGRRNLRITFPDTLKKLSMSGMRLPWNAMSLFGKLLPNLQVLKLWLDAFEGTTWDLGDGEFSNLKYLKLYEMNVKQINDSECETPFPCLEKLELYYCQRLEEIPSSFGYICTLKTICLISSPKVLDSAREIVELQQELGNQDFQFVVSDYDINDWHSRSARRWW